MTRITPRTCLWPLAGSLSFTFALSIGLTFRSDHHCLAGTCGEWLFPLQARLHVVVWYCWLSASVTFLAVRAFHPKMRKILRTPLAERKLPLIGKQLALSGALLFIWIVSLYGIIVGIWWIRLRDYFRERGISGGISLGNSRLAAVALTGHMCDVTMGMVLIPISRHSALASFFKLSVATTLAFHMITAYTLFTLVLTHGLLYVSWVIVFEKLSGGLRIVYPILNPTYLYHEIWPGNTSSLGVWRASLIFSGLFTTFILLLMFVTTLPSIRHRHFNIFYFTHLFGILAVVIICLHASTMFYCTAPGLMMWVLDWSMRLYELRTSLDGKILAMGRGWYCLSVPLPRHRLDGCACKSPLAHFYIHHSDSSVRELHPFTTTTHLASKNSTTHETEDDIEIQFLFRKRQASVATQAPSVARLGFAPSFFGLIRKVKRRKKSSQWTDRLASLTNKTESITQTSNTTIAPEHESVETPGDVPVSLRLEGPYFTPADPACYRTVVCIVAGTGVSGALAIAGAFKEQERQLATIADAGSQAGQPNFAERKFGEVASKNERHDSIMIIPKDRVWKRCIVIWSVREDDYIDLPALRNTSTSALEVRVHFTGKGRSRLSVGDALDEFLSADGEELRTSSGLASMWVYLSGPNAFIAAGEAACKAREERRVDWFGAKWDI